MQPDPNKLEELLTEYWQVLEDTYFRTISSKDLQIFDYLEQQVLSDSGTANYLVNLFYDQESAEAVASWVSPRYESVYGSEHEALSRLNYTNMLKSFYMSIQYYLPLMNHDTQLLTPGFLRSCKKYLKGRYSLDPPTSLTPRHVEASLRQEEGYLNSALKHLHQSCFFRRDQSAGHPSTRDTPAIHVSHHNRRDLQEELFDCERQLTKVHSSNMKVLDQLRKIMFENFDNLKGDELFGTPGEEHAVVRFIPKQVELSLHLSAQRTFLRDTIYRLELRQISESIKRVGPSFEHKQASSSPSQMTDRFVETWFEDAILKEPVFLEVCYIEGLNNLRKYSLFSIHKTGNKQYKFLFSHSVGSSNPRTKVRSSSRVSQTLICERSPTPSGCGWSFPAKLYLKFFKNTQITKKSNRNPSTCVTNAASCTPTHT